MEEINVCNFKLENIKINVKELTERQREYVEIIEKYKRENYKAPSVRTIGKLLGIKDSNSTSVYATLMFLKKKGYDYTKLHY